MNTMTLIDFDELKKEFEFEILGNYLDEEEQRELISFFFHLFRGSLIIIHDKNFENDKGGETMKISINNLLLSPLNVDLRNVKTKSGIKIKCQISDEHGLDIDTEVFESEGDYYVNI